MGLHGKPLKTSRYMTASRPDHPTAHADGRVRVHRAVLYDSIGPGVHACNWCHAEVEWFASWGRELVSDHVDGDKWNNSPDNLVPSCPTCNTQRLARASTECKYGHPWTPENTRIRSDNGARQCRACGRMRQRQNRARRNAS